MARIFQDGFEMGVPSGNGTTAFGAFRGLWQFDQTSVATFAGSTIGVVSNIKNSGVYSLRHYSGGSSNSRQSKIWRSLGANLAEHYGRVEIRVVDINAATCGIVHVRDENFDTVADIRLTGTGDVKLYIDNTEVASISSYLQFGQFVRLEWCLVVDEENGKFEVRADGNSLLSWEGNTNPHNTGAIRFLCLGYAVLTGSSNVFYFDDVAVNDTTGTINNSWCGNGSILLLKPKDNGHYSQFTGNVPADDNWEHVNEIPHDGDTTYVESEDDGDIDTYVMEKLIADHGIDSASVVKAVQVCFTGRHEGSDANLAPMLRSGTSDEEGDTLYLSSSYHRLFHQIFNVNPFTTNQWTLTDVDTLEAGVKHKEHQYG